MPEQQAQRILSLRDLPLEAGDLSGGCVEQLFRLAHVEAVRDAALPPRLGEPQVVAGDVEGPPRDLQLEIEPAKRQIRFA